MIKSTKRIKLGPLELTEQEWNELFGAAVKEANKSDESAGIIWIRQFLQLAKHRGFILLPEPVLDKTRALWRN